MDQFLKPRNTLGRYELLSPVARGGMGQVWLGRLNGARGFHRLVAIKTLLPEPQDHERLEHMLLEEARIASLIQHPNVVQTLELSEQDGTLYLVMEWVHGESLGLLWSLAKRQGGMPLAAAAHLVAQTLSGLHAAHELKDEHGAPLGVVHRDVSPHNVLVTDAGVAKLVDFGIAKATRRGASSTAAGELKGKFSYMAPEQILGAEVDRRGDLFAAGIVLYLLTTGHHPFKTEHPAGALHAIASDDPVPPPSTIVSDYPKELEAVVQRALEKSPDRRFQSAAEMQLALEHALPQSPEALAAEARAFVDQVLGERLEEKREAVRSILRAADGHGESAGAATQAARAPSGSSLGALSVDTNDADGPAGGGSRTHTVRAEPSKAPFRNRHLALGIVFGTLVSGALFSAASRLFEPNPEPLTPYASAPSDNAVLPSAAAATHSAPSDVAAEPDAGVTSSGTAEAVAPAPSASEPPAGRNRVKARPPKKTRSDPDLDLIPPHYAR